MKYLPFLFHRVFLSTCPTVSFIHMRKDTLSGCLLRKQKTGFKQKEGERFVIHYATKSVWVDMHT